MSKIVAIGGGKIAEQETFGIDRQIVGLTGRKRPRVLFIPTASGDDPDYCDNFQSVYGGQLGCPVDTLLLFRDRPSKSGIKRTILSAELIYVGGGNTLRMMKLWRRLGVDRLLRQAWRRGIVLSGLSAGACCWAQWGCSDSRRFSSPEDWKHIRVRGLGFIEGILCPHYHSEQREGPFQEMVDKYGGPGIALDDNAALEVGPEGYRILASAKSAKAYRLFKQRGEVVVEQIEPSRRYRPASSLSGPGQAATPF